MDIEAIDYAIDRGLTDAEWLYKGEVDLGATRAYWNDELAAIMADGRRSLRDFCRHIDDVGEVVTDDCGREKKNWFLRPRDIIDRTRGAIAIIEVLDEVKKGTLDIDPRDTEAVARAAQLGGVEELRNIVEQLFVVREGAWEYLLDTCGLGSGYEIDLELSDWANIDIVITNSLAQNALPEGRGSKQLIQHVRKSLLEDIERAVSRFVDQGWTINLCGLNQYSYYFRTFGVRAYLLWFDGDNAFIAKSVTERPQVIQELRRIFSPSNKWNDREMVPKWRRKDDSLPGTVRNLIAAGGTKAEIYKALCESFGFPSPADQRWNYFNVKTALNIVHFYQRHDIPIAPFPSLFRIKGTMGVSDRLEKLAAALEFCDSLKVPMKARAFIVHDSTSREELESRAYAFEQHGLRPEYYAPFMHYSITMMPFLLHQIFAVVCVERQSEAARQYPRNRTTLKQLTSLASTNRIAGHLYINRHGIPHERMHNQEVSPESVACKVRLCVEAGVAVPAPNILERFTYEDLQKKLAILRAGIKRKLRDIDYEEGEFDRFMAERHLKLPQYIADNFHRFNEVFIIQRIREIEAYGIPFTQESFEQGFVYWSWITMATRERRRKMYQSWVRIHDSERRGALCAQYGLEVDNLPVGVNKISIDRLWRYFLMIKEAGLTCENVSLVKIYSTGPERFRGYLNDTLTDMQKGGALSEDQRLYMRKFALAEYAERTLRWKAPARLFDEMDGNELSRIEHLFSKRLEIPEIRQRLEEKFRLREECITEMLYRHYSHEEIEAAFEAGDLQCVRRMLHE